MYCKHCGKEIEDDSSFCKHCGKSQGNTQKGLVNKPVWIIYLIWALANLYLLMGEKVDEASSSFYPFTSQFFPFISNYWNKVFYDFSEFIVYVFILPAILFVIYVRYNKQIDSFIDKLLNKNLR